MKILFVLALSFLSGCTLFMPEQLQPEAQIRTLLDRLEFDDDEEGCFRLNGQIDINPLPFFTTNVAMDLRKHKGDDADNC